MTAAARPRPPGWYVAVIRIGAAPPATRVERMIGPYHSQRLAERAEMGVMRNLNQDDYVTDVREEKTP